MSKKGIIGIIVLALVGIGVWYFVNGKTEVSDESETVKIGIIMPLTGPASQIGNDIFDGIKLAHSEIAKSDSRFEIIVEDSRVEPKIGLSAAEKLINVDQVDFIIGPAASGVALSVAPVCEKNNITMLSPTASTPKLTLAGDNIFRIYPSDIYDGKILSNFAYKNLELKNISILYLNNDFGLGLNKIFSQEFESAGGNIVFSEAFGEKEHDFKTMISKLKSMNIDGLFLVALVDQYSKILKQIKELGLNIQILAPVTFDDASIYETEDNIADGVIYTRPYFDANNTDTIVTEFVNKFELAHNEKPSILNALGYDSYVLTIKAFQLNNYKKTGINKILSNTKSFNGASGEIKFDANGDVIKELQIMTINNSKAIQYEY